MYKPYKLNRQDKYTQMASEEIEDEKKFLDEKQIAQYYNTQMITILFLVVTVTLNN